MHQKKIPMRMCTGCGEMKPKRELVRVVKSPEGEVSLDLTGKKPFVMFVSIYMFRVILSRSCRHVVRRLPRCALPAGDG